MKCDHGAPRIVAVVPCSAGWGVAILTRDPKGRYAPDLSITAVVAWAHVERDVERCDCEAAIVVPMTAAGGIVSLELDDPDYSEVRILEPGTTAVAVAPDGGPHYVRTVSGTWAPGDQEIADICRSAAE